MRKTLKMTSIAIAFCLLAILSFAPTASAQNASYELQIQLTNEDAQKINAAGQYVTIVKEVGGAQAGESVTWVAFSPFQDNTVSWETDYGVYASNSQVQNGATIFQVSGVNPATSGVYYPFEMGGFDPPTGNAGPNNYGVQNLEAPFTFGLSQSVNVNGLPFEGNSLNAVSVLNNQQATFTPQEILQVFLQGQFNNGVVITDVTGLDPLMVNLTEKPNQVIHYDGATGRFVPGPLS